MATFINLPHELQNHISNFLRPYKLAEGNGGELKIDPMSKSCNIGRLKSAHRNFAFIPLWKDYEWKKQIHQWRDENLTKMRWTYKYGILPDEMIKKGWEKKINLKYRRQGCYVKTTWLKGLNEFSGQFKKIKKILFEVCFRDLITGIRPLPHCFGNNGSNTFSYALGGLQLDGNFVPAPSLKTMIPKSERREWLFECFTECVLKYWGEIIIEKNGNIGKGLNFINEFKKIIHLPTDYKITQRKLFRMFLKELLVRHVYLNDSNSLPLDRPGRFALINPTENINELCRQNLPDVRLDHMAENMRQRKQ